MKWSYIECVYVEMRFKNKQQKKRLSYIECDSISTDNDYYEPFWRYGFQEICWMSKRTHTHTHAHLFLTPILDLESFQTLLWMFSECTTLFSACLQFFCVVTVVAVASKEMRPCWAVNHMLWILNEITSI